MADSSQADDNRDHSRQPIELKVEYKRINTFFSDYTKNISKGGTFIKTGRPLPVGTEFLFQLQLPAIESPIQITGKVQWIVSDEEAGEPTPDGVREAGMGIRFVYASDEERIAVEQRVEKLIVDSLGQRLYTKLMEHSRDEQDD